jgi:thiol-disulfide isomerase/thioredoxin
VPGWAIGLVVAVAVLGAATGFGVFWRRRDGRVRAVAEEAGSSAPETAVLAGLGVEPGTPATLLQFSSAFCAPCRATKRICAEIAGTVTGVRHIEVDAESHLDAVRALGVLRTPTLFIVDGSGRIVRRASGLPTKAHVLAAVGELV